jgi:predicted alpha/beta-hydrolase family hydrolase
MTPKPSGALGSVLLAHGAGGHKDHPHMLDLDAILSGIGLSAHRFNFPYREQGGKFPDRMPVLVESYRREAEKILTADKPALLILAGHSMGARAASMLAAEGFPCRGLILFSYPLHPPGKPEKIRREHLDQIKAPVLSLSGTRDVFCAKKLMEETVRSIAEKAKEAKPMRGAWTHHWLEGADHGLQVLKSSGRNRADVLSEAANACRLWLTAIG